MSRIEKHDARTWIVHWDEYTPDGKRRQRSKSFSRAADAKAYALQLDNGEILPESQSRTMAQYADAWWALYRTKLEASTMDSYYRILTRIKAHFGARPLDKIRPIDIDRFYALLMSPNNGLSRCALAPASIERHHAVLHVLFKYALRDGVIKSNPMDRVECPREPEKELTLPDLDDVKAFLIDSQKNPCYVGICIAYYAALRRSEILGLKWSDIDMRTGRLHVRRVRQRLRSGPDEIQLNAYTHRINLPGMEHWIERDCTKSKHDRSFIMPRELTTILRNERKRQAANRLGMGSDYIISDYVCVHDDGTPISDNQLSKAMSGLCRLHDLRHLNLSYQIDAGLPITEISRRAGHTTIDTTLKVYAHALKTQDAESAEAIDAAFGITK